MPMTRRAYLQWLIDANLYLDPRGARRTQRQVQLKLDDIYLSLRARPEMKPERADRQLLQAEQAATERELEAGRISATETEERRDLLWAKVERAGLIAAPATPLDLYKVVADHERLVILGDPGSGKTTLLRHLALQHAQTLM